MSTATPALGLSVKAAPFDAIRRAAWPRQDARIPLRLVLPSRPPEPQWRQAMRWSLIALTASMAAGEIALAMLGA
jgi:hypothetical protein